MCSHVTLVPPGDLIPGNEAKPPPKVNFTALTHLLQLCTMEPGAYQATMWGEASKKSFYTFIARYLHSNSHCWRAAVFHLLPETLRMNLCKTCGKISYCLKQALGHNNIILPFILMGNLLKNEQSAALPLRFLDALNASLVLFWIDFLRNLCFG